VGFETLIRWQHPTQGLKTPGEFLPVAKEVELISALDFWVLQQAC
jgi:EAL domain-containing protein (putative c-di-GMP-specific phosphodiesterase class I)